MISWNHTAARLGSLALAAALLVPAFASAEIFAWRTDDGVFAYTDDPENIPSRYSERAVALRGKAFADYDRLTVADAEASRAVTRRLRERLDYLRAFNRGAEAYTAKSQASGEPMRITVATGSPQAPTLDVTSGASDSPVVVETVLGKARGDLVTRSSTIVTQGDRTLAVLKGRRNTHNLSDDILDLDEAAE